MRPTRASRLGAPVARLIAVRIGLIARRFDPAGGGTERDLIVTAEMLRDAGHRVSIYADEVRAAAPGWTVIASGLPRIGRTARLIVFAMTAASRARREGAEMVIGFARVVGADVLRSGGSAHASYVRSARVWRGPAASIAMRLSPYHRAQIAIERRAFTSARMRLAIGVSEMVRQDLAASFNLDPERTATLYNGVDLERFHPREPEIRRSARAELGVPDGVPMAIFVGNGFARKGLGCLLEAWPAVDQKTILLVVGNDRGLTRFRRRADRLGLGSRVVFTGPRNDIDRMFAAADFLALPSLFEPFGNVVLEAMASGLPVLTSSRVGAAEILPESMRRYVVKEPTDPSEIAWRARELADNVAGLAAQARTTAETCTWENYRKGLLGLITGVAGRLDRAPR